MATRNPWDTHIKLWVPLVHGPVLKPVLFFAPPVPVRIPTFQPALTFEEAETRMVNFYSPGTLDCMEFCAMVVNSPNVDFGWRLLAAVGLGAFAANGVMETGEGLRRDFENKTLGPNMVKLLTDPPTTSQ